MPYKAMSQKTRYLFLIEATVNADAPRSTPLVKREHEQTLTCVMGCVRQLCGKDVSKITLIGQEVHHQTKHLFGLPKHHRHIFVHTPHGGVGSAGRPVKKFVGVRLWVCTGWEHKTKMLAFDFSSVQM